MKHGENSRLPASENAETMSCQVIYPNTSDIVDYSHIPLHSGSSFPLKTYRGADIHIDILDGLGRLNLIIQKGRSKTRVNGTAAPVPYYVSCEDRGFVFRTSFGKTWGEEFFQIQCVLDSAATKNCAGPQLKDDRTEY